MLSDHVQAVMQWESRAPDTQAFGQAREHAHDEFDEGTLPMKDRAEGLQKIAVTGDTQQLPPLGWPLARRFPQPTSPWHRPSGLGQKWLEMSTWRRRPRVMARRGGAMGCAPQ